MAIPYDVVTALNLPELYCNITRSKLLHIKEIVCILFQHYTDVLDIKILEEFRIDLFVIFLNI